MSEETTEYTERSDLDFLRDVLVDALESRRDNLIPRLFKLYEEVRSPAPTIPTGNIDLTTLGNDYNFSLTSDYLDDTVAAGDVAIGNGLGEDVISFGDYKA